MGAPRSLQAAVLRTNSRSALPSLSSSLPLPLPSVSLSVSLSLPLPLPSFSFLSVAAPSKKRRAPVCTHAIAAALAPTRGPTPPASASRTHRQPSLSRIRISLPASCLLWPHEYLCLRSCTSRGCPGFSVSQGQRAMQAAAPASALPTPGPRHDLSAGEEDGGGEEAEEVREALPSHHTLSLPASLPTLYRRRPAHCKPPPASRYNAAAGLPFANRQPPHGLHRRAPPSHMTPLSDQAEEDPRVRRTLWSPQRAQGLSKTAIAKFLATAGRPAQASRWVALLGARGCVRRRAWSRSRSPGTSQPPCRRRGLVGRGCCRHGRCQRRRTRRRWQRPSLGTAAASSAANYQEALSFAHS